MPTVIDSLVVELGLDPTKFTKGQREALDSAKKLEDQTLRSGKNIEEGAVRASEAMGNLRMGTLAAFGAITGSAGLVKFATDAIHAGAAVGRLSRNIGVSTQTISKFQSVAEVFGGSAEGMASSFVQISDALEGWKIGDVKAVIADYRALGGAGGTLIDINKGVEQTFLDIAKNLQNVHDTQGPAMAGYWQRRLGIDPGFFDAMIQKGEGFNEVLRKMRGLTDEEADAAGKAERSWNKLIQNVTNAGRNFVLDQVKKTQDDISDPQNYVMHYLFGGLMSGAQKAVEAPASQAGGAFTSQAEKEAFIRSEAAKRGINPNVAKAVADSEGFKQFSGDNGTSFGAFQLHVTPGGRGKAVGDQFRAATGLDPADKNNERATIAFALDDARKNGWTAYHGAANTGIGQWQGIDRGGGGSNSTTSVHIDTVNVTPRAGDDADTFANRFAAAVGRQSFGFQATGGQE